MSNRRVWTVLVMALAACGEVKADIDAGAPPDAPPGTLDGGPEPDGQGGTDGGVNLPPVVQSVIVNPSPVQATQMAQVTCTAMDPENEPLDYLWSATVGSISTPGGNAATWTAPIEIGSAVITCTARDPLGQTGSGTVTTDVILPVDGLIGLYLFNGNADDSSGFGNHGTRFGSASIYQQDRFGAAGGALTFNGFDHYVSLANESAFDLTAFTIAAFVWIDSSSATRALVSKSGATGFGNYDLHVFGETGGPIDGRLAYAHDTAGGNWSTLGSSGPLLTGAFIHLAMTLNAAEAQFYVDGMSGGPVPMPPPPTLNNSPATIGRDGSNFWDGRIDEVRIYNRALTPEEILALSIDR